VKLWPSIIIVLYEVKSKEQGQTLLLNRNKLPLLTYFTTTIWVVNKKSYKKQKKKVGFELFSNKPIILTVAKGGKGRN
jgi:hypothetical protein